MIDRDDLQRIAVNKVKDAEGETVERPEAQAGTRQQMGKAAGTDTGAFGDQIASNDEFVNEAFGHFRRRDPVVIIGRLVQIGGGAGPDDDAKQE